MTRNDKCVPKFQRVNVSRLASLTSDVSRSLLSRLGRTFLYRISAPADLDTVRFCSCYVMMVNKIRRMEQRLSTVAPWRRFSSTGHIYITYQLWFMSAVHLRNGNKNKIGGPGVILILTEVIKKCLDGLYGNASEEISTQLTLWTLYKHVTLILFIKLNTEYHIINTKYVNSS